VVRRWVDWSYSLQPLADEIKNLRQKWALAQQLVETGAQDVLGGLTGEAVGKSEFGAAVAALYAEKRSDERQAVTGRLIEALRAAPTQASALPTLRGVVAALRRLGGDAAAEALYSRLVGPAVQVQQPTAVGVPGGRGAMMGPMAPVEGMLGAGGMGGMMAPVSGDDSGVAVYVARALGSMGREDLLRKALAAQGSQYYQASPAGVQRAVLDGMAYLPAARNPARVLDGLLLRATNEALRSAAADALVTAFRHMGSETGGTGA
jgi:hypothetical protein